MMEIDEEDILRNVAAGGSMDYSHWPALLPWIVSRIEKIAQDEFPIPQLLSMSSNIVIPSSIPRPAGASSDSEDTENFLPPLPSSPAGPSSTTSSQETNKENTPVTTRATAQPSSVPSAAPSASLPPGTLPRQITAMVTEITKCLTSTFPQYPPHTVQRLSELVLTPKHHYKSLPAYLHALDRVVHVTSGLNVYPLPPAVPDISTVSLLSNGISDPSLSSPSPWATPGSDEALGGALLTPIPWLQHTSQPQPLSPAPQSETSGSSGTSSERQGSNGAGSDTEGELRTESTETIDGPNGMGSIETVTVINVNGVPSMGARGVGVTQGELLRQEQRAGVVPVSQLPGHHALHLSPHPQHLRSAASSSSSSAPNSGAENGSTAGAEGSEDSGGATHSVPTVEDEKPHARGPEEIGAADMGPQRESNTSPNYSGGPGVEMQGIDVEAAVGRKASEPESKGDKADKMEGVEPTSDDAVEKIDRARSSTPKREAEDEVGGASKRLKEDTSSMDADEITAATTEEKEDVEVDSEGKEAVSGTDKSDD